MSKKSVGIAAIGGAKTRSRKYLLNKKFSESVSFYISIYQMNSGKKSKLKRIDSEFFM